MKNDNLRTVTVKYLGAGLQEEIFAVHPYADQDTDDTEQIPMQALIDVKPDGSALDVLIAARCVGNVPPDVNTNMLWQNVEREAAIAKVDSVMLSRLITETCGKYDAKLWFLVTWDLTPQEVQFLDVFATVH